MQRLLRSIPLALAGLLLAGTAFAQAPGGPPPAVTVAKPVVKDVVEYDEFTGRFEAADSRRGPGPRLAATSRRSASTDGALVKKGDPLFVIDRRPYKAALDQAQATRRLGAGAR